MTSYFLNISVYHRDYQNVQKEKENIRELSFYQWQNILKQSNVMKK